MSIGILSGSNLFINILALLIGLLGTKAMAPLALTSLKAVVSPTEVSAKAAGYEELSLSELPKLKKRSFPLRVQLTDISSVGSRIRHRKMNYHCFVSSSSPSRNNKILIQFCGQPRTSGTVQGLIYNKNSAKETIKEAAPEAEAKFFMREEPPANELATSGILLFFVLICGGFCLGLTFISFAALVERRVEAKRGTHEQA